METKGLGDVSRISTTVTVSTSLSSFFFFLQANFIEVYIIDYNVYPF